MLVNQQGRHYQSGKPLPTDLRKPTLEEIVCRGRDLAAEFFPGTFVGIANYFHVSPAFVSKLWKQVTDTGEFEARKGIKRQPIVSGGELELMAILKTAQPSMPLKKKFSPVNVNYCQEFLNFISNVDPHRLKYFAECGFALPDAASTKYGSSLKGAPCVDVGKYITNPNVTLNLWIGTGGIMYADTVDGSVDTIEFLKFFDHTIYATDSMGRPTLDYGDILVWTMLDFMASMVDTLLQKYWMILAWRLFGSLHIHPNLTQSN